MVKTPVKEKCPRCIVMAEERSVKECPLCGHLYLGRRCCRVRDGMRSLTIYRRKGVDDMPKLTVDDANLTALLAMLDI